MAKNPHIALSLCVHYENDAWTFTRKTLQRFNRLSYNLNAEQADALAECALDVLHRVHYSTVLKYDYPKFAIAIKVIRH